MSPWVDKQHILSSPLAGLTLLIFTIVIMIVALLVLADWIDPQGDTSTSTVYVVPNTPTPLAFPKLTIRPTGQERSIAAMLAVQHSQESPEDTLAVYNRLLDTLVQQRLDMDRVLEGYVVESLESESLELKDCLPTKTPGIYWRFEGYIERYEPLPTCTEPEEIAPGSFSPSSGSYVD